MDKSLAPEINSPNDLYAKLVSDLGQRIAKVLMWLSVPLDFTRELALWLVPDMDKSLFDELKELSFIHKRPDCTYVYSASARSYFENRMKEDQKEYVAVNKKMREYIRLRLEFLQGEHDKATRNLRLVDAIHTLNYDLNEGMDMMEALIIATPISHTLVFAWTIKQIYESRGDIPAHREKFIDDIYLNAAKESQCKERQSTGKK